MRQQRVSTAFHETFALNLPAITAILSTVANATGAVTEIDIKAEGYLGNNYVKSMPKYSRACGLLQFGGFSPTEFGNAVVQHDISLSKKSTLWLMHYFLSSPGGPGPAYWRFAVTEIFRIGDVLNTVTVGQKISDFIETTTGERLKERTTKDAASVLLRTYAKNDALGKLGFLSEVDQKGGVYVVNEPEIPSPWVIGYALANYWESTFGDRTGVNLSDIAEKKGFMDIFHIGPGMLLSMLTEMQREGFLQIQRIAPPYQLVKLWQDKKTFLEHLYANELG